MTGISGTRAPACRLMCFVAYFECFIVMPLHSFVTFATILAWLAFVAFISDPGVFLVNSLCDIDGTELVTDALPNELYRLLSPWFSDFDI